MGQVCGVSSVDLSRRASRSKEYRIVDQMHLLLVRQSCVPLPSSRYLQETNRYARMIFKTTLSLLCAAGKRTEQT